MLFPAENEATGISSGPVVCLSAHRACDIQAVTCSVAKTGSSYVSMSVRSWRLGKNDTEVAEFYSVVVYADSNPVAYQKSRSLEKGDSVLLECFIRQAEGSEKYWFVVSDIELQAKAKPDYLPERLAEFRDKKGGEMQ